MLIDPHHNDPYLPPLIRHEQPKQVKERRQKAITPLLSQPQQDKSINVPTVVPREPKRQHNRILRPHKTNLLLSNETTATIVSG